MPRRGGEDHTLLWVGLGCGGALLGLLVLGGALTTLWALGFLPHRRSAGAKPEAAPAATPGPVVPFVPAGNPLAPLRPSGRLTAANCEKLKPGMTEAEVRAILGPPTSEVRMPDMRGMGGVPAEAVEMFPAKVLNYQEFFNQLQVSVNAAGRVAAINGMVGGRIFQEMAPPKGPNDNPPQGQQPAAPFGPFPGMPFPPGGVPGMPGNPFAPPCGPPAPPQGR